MTGSSLPLARCVRCCWPGSLHWRTASAQEGKTMQIQFMLNGTVVKATLENTPATRDLVAMLPLTVTLRDYASTEKIAYLKQPLSREGAPEGVEPRAGDVTYYA